MPGTRHKMRRAVVQAVYSWLLEGESHLDVLASSLADWQVEPDDAERGRELLEAVLQNHSQLENLLADALEHWSIERVGAVELSVIYVILQEMISFPEVPIEVLIDEAVRLAKEFAGDESAHFVNGILDALAASVRNIPAESES